MPGIIKERQLRRDARAGVLNEVSKEDIDEAEVDAEAAKIAWKAGIQPTNVGFMRAVNAKARKFRLKFTRELQGSKD